MSTGLWRFLRHHGVLELPTPEIKILWSSDRKKAQDSLKTHFRQSPDE